MIRFDEGQLKILFHKHIKWQTGEFYLIHFD